MKNLILSAAIFLMAALLLTPSAMAQPEEGEMDILHSIPPEHEAFIEHAEFEGVTAVDFEHEPDILFDASDDAEIYEFRDRKRGENIKEKLNLTEEQKEKIRSLRVTHQEKMIDLKAELQKARLHAKDQRHSDNVNRSEVLASVERLNNIRNEIALASANHRMDVYEILTPDQRKVWKEIREDHSMRKGIRKKFFEKRKDLHHR